MDEENHNKEIVSEIIENVDGEFKVSLPGNFHRLNISMKCRRNIESKTNTTIKIPYKKPKEDIEVVGSTRSSVETALKEIENIVAQQKQRLTHFLSIPINDPGILVKFNQFKNEVSQLDGNFTDEYFQRAYKLHLTLGVLTLSSDEDRNSAIEALQESREIIGRAKIRFNNPGDLKIKIVGVDCMNSKPANCKVLYGAVDSEILQTIANEIVGHFISKGLIEEDKNEVKLHLTMMNVVFVNRRTEKRGPKKFDASSIVEKFANFEFGEQKFEEIHLSRFGGSGEGAYYEAERVLNVQ